MTQIAIDTPRGQARVHVTHPSANPPRAGLVLGHGAGGGIAAPDLQTAATAALSLDLAVALVEQPYRVAGRRSAAPAAHLDEAWTAVVAQLAAGEFADLGLVVGGRSSGARVACRTASATGAVGVLCLAFPLLPPARAAATRPVLSRLPELDAVNVPTLVVQGERDRFGIPPAAQNRSVVRVTGDHALKSDLGAIERAVTGWLRGLIAAGDGEAQPLTTPV